MILDANILLYAVDADSPHHHAASDWLTSALNGSTRVGLSCQTVAAFVRIATHPRASRSPLSATDAHAFVDSWLAAPAAWVPPAGDGTLTAYRVLTTRHQVTGNLVPDALLAALALENGVPVVSADSDFARFPEVAWINPLLT
ncbi:MAG: TA system VapC family ribonuclease toxin [Dermatophilaceae bacterium]